MESVTKYDLFEMALYAQLKYECNIVMDVYGQWKN